MVQLILLLISLVQSVTVNQIVPDKNFALIDDFDKDQSAFRADTFDLTGYSTEGGELVVFHNKDKNYLVIDIWLFGEMGKVNAKYWTDKNLNFIIVRRKDFKYDKPFYEKNLNMTETIEYISYNAGKVKSYDGARKELADSVTTGKKERLEDFFKDITKDLKIVK